MNRNKRIICAFFASLFTVTLFLDQSFAEIERFTPRQGGATVIWRITDNPAQRDWANYHNTEAWNPDGRYICYES